MENEQLKKRLDLVKLACISLGEALLKCRSQRDIIKTKLMFSGQLKSVLDVAAENWIINFLQAGYPKDNFLAEERYETSPKYFKSSKNYWLIDALDGTKSYFENYETFCIQAAFVQGGRPVLGIVHAPLLEKTYWALRGGGAYLKERTRHKRIFVAKNRLNNLSYIDNRPVAEQKAKFLQSINVKRFIEAGSFGLKICQVAEGKADIFFKPVEFKIWDTAPGDLILQESGGIISLLNGRRIDYSGRRIYQHGLIAANPKIHNKALAALKNFKYA